MTVLAPHRLWCGDRVRLIALVDGTVLYAGSMIGPTLDVAKIALVITTGYAEQDGRCGE